MPEEDLNNTALTMHLWLYCVMDHTYFYLISILVNYNALHTAMLLSIETQFNINSTRHTIKPISTSDPVTTNSNNATNSHDFDDGITEHSSECINWKYGPKSFRYQKY